MITNFDVSPGVIDATEENFQAEVIERSRTVPVIVDFWASWCGPCRVLGPVLEKLAEEYSGDFVLAKVDVDSNQNLAMQFRVQGIPAVKAFLNGRVVNEFTGALPEPQVRQFIQSLVPSEADLLAQEGLRLEQDNYLNEAAINYQAAIDKETGHYFALLGLGRAQLKLGQVEEALSTLERIPNGVHERNDADALVASAQFQRYATGHNEAELRARLAANSKDIDSRFALASLLAIQQRYQEALEEFLEVVGLDRNFNADGARKAMLALFTMLGEEHELTDIYRRKLASALF